MSTPAAPDSAESSSLERERLVDYLLVVSRRDPLNAIDGQTTDDPMNIAFEVDVVDQFPRAELQDMPVPPGIALFCIPEGVRFSEKPGIPKFHSFATTAENGQRLYGFCLQFYEQVQTHELRAAAEIARLNGIRNRQKKKERRSLGNPNLELDPSLFSAAEFLAKSTNGGVQSPISLTSERNGSRNSVEKMNNSRRSFKSSTEWHEVPSLSLSDSIKADRLQEDFRVNSLATLAGGESKATIYAPKSICILSKWMFMTQFREFLTNLYRRSLTPSELPLERYICNLVNEIPIPPIGRIRVQFYIADIKISFARPPANNPLSFTNFPFMRLFQHLDENVIVELFEHVLLEHQILLISSQYSLLTIATEALCALIFPFQWHHVYIPLLPQPLLDFLNAPVPFIAGTISSYIRDLETLPRNIIVCDLDHNAIYCKIQYPPLPKKQRAKLLNSLKPLREWRQRKIEEDHLFQHLDSAFDYAPPPESFNRNSISSTLPFGEGTIRYMFLRVFLSLLKNYQEFIINPENIDSIDLFDKESFMKEMGLVNSEFMNQFLSTQCFIHFIEERIFNPSFEDTVAFFDEAIVAKLNRSLLSRTKPTPFLEDSSQNPAQLYICPPPDKNSLKKSTFCYETWPLFDASLFIKPRAVKHFVFKSKFADMKSRTQKFSMSRKFLSPISTSDRDPLSPEEAVAKVFAIWFCLFSSVISSTREGQYLSHAFRILRRMKKLEITPEAVIWTSLIEACGFCKVPEQALKVLEAMQDFNVIADASSYSSLLKVFSQNGDLHRAYQALGASSSAIDESVGIETDRKSNVSFSLGNSLLYGNVVNMKTCSDEFTRTFPGVTISTTETCPTCENLVADEYQRIGWSRDPNDYTTRCNSCKSRFVGRFTLQYFLHSSSEKKMICCEYLSPMVLQKEIDTLLKRVDGKYLSSSDFHRNSPSIFWNIAWHFSNVQLPVGFLLPWLVKRRNSEEMKSAPFLGDISEVNLNASFTNLLHVSRRSQ